MGERGFSFPVQYVRIIADEVETLGADVGAWLRASGLPDGALDSPRLSLSLGQFVALIENAVSATQEPALGLLVGRRLGPTTHGMLGYAALTSGTLRQTLGIFERFTMLRTSLVAIGLATNGTTARVTVSERQALAGARGPVLEAIVASVKSLIGALSLGTCEVSEVGFPFPAPPHAALVHDVLGCGVVYDASHTYLALPTAALDVPLKMGDEEAFREAALFCERELAKLTSDESFAARIKKLLLDRPTEFPSLELTARTLRLTPRTLHRRLVEEGTSYRAVLDEVRHALALEHVKTGRSNMEEIAYVLGYADLASFRRAFKRWENAAPSVYRERHATIASAHKRRS